MSSRNKFMIIGAVVGAILGAVAAYTYFESERTGGLLTQKKVQGREVTVKAGAMDFLRIGTAVYAVVKQLQTMVKPV